ncbi:hypothetical protein Q7O56_16340 [Pseudomonas protegens]|uniref:hypothetical protein n=1 Tax=Pseudomonas protegens TaxID=380021 RepID=UPI002758A912|nr:hypothetical protein [Pseudomonas protegens]MDP9510625.1 hypothetical protein [Pseudomonas protegens]
MILDSFIEDSLKPVHGLLTKKRLAVFAFSLFLISPENHKIIDLITKNPNILELTTQISTSITALPAIPTLSIAFIIFFLSAKIYQNIAKQINKLRIKKQNTIITSLSDLEKREDLFFLDKKLEIETEWKDEKEKAEIEIKKTTDLSEILISTTLVSLYLVASSNYPAAASIILALVTALYCHFSSKSILINYLSHIAPYKIAASRLNKISLASKNQKLSP